MLRPSSSSDDLICSRSLNNISTDLQRNHGPSPSPPPLAVQHDDAEKLKNRRKHYSTFDIYKDHCLKENLNSYMGQDSHADEYHRFMNCMEQEQPEISEEEEENKTKEGEESSDEKKKEDKDEDCGRERLKKHRMEMAGRVWIPDIWGQESFLKDWIDCSAFDRSLVPNGLVSARTALVEECQRAASSGTRIVSRCS